MSTADQITDDAPLGAPVEHDNDDADRDATADNHQPAPSTIGKLGGAVLGTFALGA